MIALFGKFKNGWDEEPFVVRVRTSPDQGDSCRSQEAFLLRDNEGNLPEGFRLCLTFESQGIATDAYQRDGRRLVVLPQNLRHLSEGDIIRLSPRSGEVWVMYRLGSMHDELLVTERCNNRCIMCSQPPRQHQDAHLFEACLAALRLMDPATPLLGITGGEPTLLGAKLPELLTACMQFLPQTSIHVLSNGRLLRYLSFCEDISLTGHPDLMFGIPLYSDIASLHDYVVQAAGAFDDTVRGMMNLARCNIPVEIRVVIHKQTVDRLPQLARFITRNMPYVEHVALMGLELTGYTKRNLTTLWTDPFEYKDTLAEATEILAEQRLNVSIYNHPLCLLNTNLWPIARKSISDWKNRYFEECSGCAVKEQCGGFFASSEVKRSQHIRPFEKETVS